MGGIISYGWDIDKWRILGTWAFNRRQLSHNYIVPTKNNEINLFLYFQKMDILKMSKIEK